MKDLLFTVQTILIIGAIVAGVLFVGQFFWSNHENSKEAQKERYFQCLERTEKETCDKIFYNWETKDKE